MAAQYTAQPEVTPTTTPEPEANAEPRGGSTDIAILVPTALAIVFGVTAVLCLSVKTQGLWWRKRFRVLSTIQDGRVKVTPSDAKLPQCDAFLDEQALATLEDFKEFQNKPSGLLGVMLPPACSLALCPITLYLYRPLIQLFWPDGVSDDDDTDDNINSIIYSFLIPSGFVYATTFGFAFEETTSKRRRITQSLSSFCSLVYTVNTLAVHIGTLDLSAQKALVCNLRSHTLLYMKRLINSAEDTDESSNAVLSEALCILQDVSLGAGQVPAAPKKPATGRRSRHSANNSSLMGIFSKVEELQNHIRVPNTRPLNVLQWLFLECLAFIAYFGILLLRAKSTNLELTMCFLTVFSISTFSYVLADMDCPFHGLFRVRLAPLVDTLDDLSQQYISLPANKLRTK